MSDKEPPGGTPQRRRITGIVALIVSVLAMAGLIAFAWHRHEEVEDAHARVVLWRCGWCLTADEEAVRWLAIRDGMGGVWERLPTKDRAIPYEVLADQFIAEEKYTEAFYMICTLSANDGKERIQEKILVTGLGRMKEALQNFISNEAQKYGDLTKRFAQASLAMAADDWGEVMRLTDIPLVSPQAETKEDENARAWLLFLRARALQESGQFQAARILLIKIMPSLSKMSDIFAIRVYILTTCVNIADRAGERKEALALAESVMEDLGSNVSWAERRKELMQIIERLKSQSGDNRGSSPEEPPNLAPNTSPTAPPEFGGHHT